MSKREMLEGVLEDYKSHLHMVKEIHIIYANGTKAGIGNPHVIGLVMDTLISEAERQLNELNQ